MDEQNLNDAIDRFSFERMTGRKRGTEDRSNFIRKGVIGDWANHFTRETAEIFDHYAGDMLVEMGYESDRNWIDRYELPS